MSTSSGPDLATWWHQLLASALVGTARRPVPDLPDLDGLGLSPRDPALPEPALLDAAALGSILMAAGATPAAPPAPDRAVPAGTSGPGGAAHDRAAPDTRPAAPDRAAQLLSLIVTQNPAGTAAFEPLVRRWCRTADRHGYRLPHDRLPQLLALGRTRPGLRDDIALVLGERGRWLASLLPDAGWVAPAPASAASADDPSLSDPDADPDADVDPVTWARLADAQRLQTLQAARRRDPALARSLVESTWPTDPARTRKAHLEALERGLGPDDEAFLEGALDDRAATVRAVAASLLDGLPGSDRAARMADRLRPLLRVHRLPRARIDVDLPDDPDAAGLRDGLGEPPRGTSRRAHWLRQITAAAPLSTWTDASGTDVRTTYSRITSAEAREGIRLAVARRRDREWARAVALAARPDEGAVDPVVVGLLEPVEAEQLILARAGSTVPTLTAAIRSAPSPWSSTLSTGLVTRCRRAGDAGEAALPTLAPRVEDLHPDVLPLLEQWAAEATADPGRRLLRDLVQHLSLNQSIEEALAP